MRRYEKCSTSFLLARPTKAKIKERENTRDRPPFASKVLNHKRNHATILQTDDAAQLHDKNHGIILADQTALDGIRTLAGNGGIDDGVTQEPSTHQCDGA